MQNIQQLLITFIPCVLIYLIYKLNLISFLTDKFTTKIKLEKPHKAKVLCKKPSFGNFLFAWVFPLVLLFSYLYFTDVEKLILSNILAYILVLGVAAGIGHWFNLKSYKKKLNGIVE